MIEEGKVIKGCGYPGMLPAEGFFVDLQRSFQKRLCLGVASGGVVKVRQIVEAFGNIGMIGSEDLFPDLQGFFQKRLGVGIFACLEQ